MKRWRNIWSDQGGNTAVMFGLAIVPIVGLSGGAVDFSRRAHVRVEMQSAADTAALAAGRILQSRPTTDAAKLALVKEDAREAAENVFRAALANTGDGDGPMPTIEFVDGVVRVSGDVTVPTSFLGVIGISSLQAKALAEVAVPDPTFLEVAMVLDFSGSMQDADKYVRMASAATDFIERMEASRPDLAKIAVVPFSEFVYAALPTGNIRDTAGADANVPLTTCLMNRGYPYSATEEQPLANVAGSRWPQSDPNQAACLQYATNSLRVLDLTSDFDSLTASLSAMRPTRLTNITLGAEIGWHVLSPGEPFDSARPYSDPVARKILILLTDGMQTVAAEGPDGSTSTQAADEVTAELCDSMDSTGVDVFTIAYDVTDEGVRSLLAGCASSAGNYYEPIGANSVATVFEDIFAQITESAWLSR
ncbi:MAG: pilus assembly protein TadG-related protein [Pseudomonadota bacterium]|nr:pilus assembly protein TadG-related protein [Pseudomonadota bacterium]